MYPSKDVSVNTLYMFAFEDEGDQNEILDASNSKVIKDPEILDEVNCSGKGQLSLL